MLCALSQSILSKHLSRDLVILAYSIGEFFDAIEIVDGNCAPLSTSNWHGGKTADWLKHPLT